ncbi:phosphoadenosine phosphosulfate reductase [Lyngbya confervoides]|uniref:Phosphoadenosine 5'-phosphosulfate reductase n=1 Tax=Lyngbya confervoides BDU141951 TaxID=1574623 RepID=A0ABD4SYF2_9CYAN|nr:phosphoadenosine phosphosulfate reductase [Lyngbya confervoides]MCM1981344.1 phosphoadenosine phosphosulfate reductase [Lyngbya confervoides BDU141951]
MTHRSAAIQTALNLEALNQQFANAHPKSILLWSLETVPEGLIQSTAFGPSGMVILDLLYRDLDPRPPVPILFLDTLHHFPETLALVHRTQRDYRLHLEVYRPQGLTTREAFAQRYGDDLWEKDVDYFHQLTKVAPLQLALQELGVKSWITGRRRDQSISRQQLPIFEWDDQGRLKINPLAHWTHREVWKYIMENKVPYNHLHDQGYGSIGDEPLTTPLQEGEHEREGRWRGTAKTECGIHR